MSWKRTKQQHTLDDVAAAVETLKASLGERLAHLEAEYQALREKVEENLEKSSSASQAMQLAIAQNETGYQTLKEDVNDKLEKVALASKAMWVAITQQSGWTRLPVSSTFQDLVTDEIHGALPLLVTPAFDLLLTFHNPLYGSHTATNLIIPRRYVRLQDVTLSNGHNGVALITDWEIAPRGWQAAMQSLTAEQDSEIWLSDFKQASDQENQAVIHRYPFVSDEELARSAPWAEKHGVMFFDLTLGYSRDFVNPILEASKPGAVAAGHAQIN
jgi:hypothetical protein